MSLIEDYENAFPNQYVMPSLTVKEKKLFKTNPSPEYVEVYLTSLKKYISIEPGILLRFHGKRKSKSSHNEVIDLFLPIGYPLHSFLEAMDAIIQNSPERAYYKRRVGYNSSRINKKEEDYTEEYLRALSRLKRRSIYLGTSRKWWKDKENCKYESQTRLIIYYEPIRVFGKHAEYARKPWKFHVINVIENCTKLENVGNSALDLYLSTEQISEMTTKIFDAIMDLKDEFYEGDNK